MEDNGDDDYLQSTRLKPEPKKNKRIKGNTRDKKIGKVFFVLFLNKRSHSVYIYLLACKYSLNLVTREWN